MYAYFQHRQTEEKRGYKFTIVLIDNACVQGNSRLMKSRRCRDQDFTGADWCCFAFSSTSSCGVGSYS